MLAVVGLKYKKTEIIMKQLTILAALLIQTAFAQTGKKVIPEFKISIPADFIITKGPDIIISNWFSLQLKLVNTPAETYLKGSQLVEDFTNNERDNFVALVYVWIPGDQFPAVRSLPAKLEPLTQSPDAAFCFRYVIDQGVFKLTVKNPDPSLMNSELCKTLEEFRYRCILVPRTVYQTINIDWSNYEAAALALNF